MQIRGCERGVGLYLRCTLYQCMMTSKVFENVLPSFELKREHTKVAGTKVAHKKCFYVFYLFQFTYLFVFFIFFLKNQFTYGINLSIYLFCYFFILQCLPTILYFTLNLPRTKNTRPFYLAPTKICQAILLNTKICTKRALSRLTAHGG